MREQLVRDIEQLIPALRRYARFLVRDVHGADDLVQDCLERAVRHLDQFQEGTDLRAWSLTIMRNCFFDGKRRDGRRIEMALDDLSYDEAADVLGVSVGTVKSRVSRGREALRRATAAEPQRKSA